MNDVEIKDGKGGKGGNNSGEKEERVTMLLRTSVATMPSFTNLYRPAERRAVFAKRKKDSTLMKKLGRGPEREDARMETKECLASIVLRPQTQRCVSDLIT